MEEQRIGIMYLNLLTRRLRHLWDTVFGADFRRSRLVPLLLIVLIVAIPATGWMLHRRGKFSMLKRQINGEQQAPPLDLPKPGGLEPLVLRRSATAGAVTPELVSATFLPGLGMQVIQLSAALPGQGELPLLSAPSVAALADGTVPPRSALYDTRGALEAPWGGLLMGQVSPIGSTMAVSWNGHTFEVPTEVSGRGIVDGGLLADRTMDAEQASTDTDGNPIATGSVQTDFGGQWPAETAFHVSARLTATALELSIVARNTGTQPEPMGLGWHPRFVIPHDRRDLVELRLPGGERLEIGDRSKGSPSGAIVPADGLLARMQAHPTGLAGEGLDETLVHFKTGADFRTGADDPLAAEFRVPGTGYGLRLISLSAATRALRIEAPSGATYVSLGMQTNLDDPLGRQWALHPASAEPAIAILAPGQTLAWKLRLEIFPLPDRIPTHTRTPQH